MLRMKEIGMALDPTIPTSANFFISTSHFSSLVFLNQIIGSQSRLAYQRNPDYWMRVFRIGMMCERPRWRCATATGFPPSHIQVQPLLVIYPFHQKLLCEFLK
eukprot:Gregarina_sp_Poly_1__811@NODE_1193_length_4817_cov_50_219579_g820_i0_p3_GENE_NODE_1193_length_4817_cov_50_219579_g820_i0NODE_1193_length_4817_cov_50_219579_g820_i0_p3_ORF_typecomplete_len103_score5_05_NODE_1193_length_4817_cov_50_219579_g820_i036723980